MGTVLSQPPPPPVAPQWNQLWVQAIVGSIGAASVALLVLYLERTEREGVVLYETNLLVNQYLGFHYCPPEEYMEHVFGPRNSLDFPRRCVEVCFRYKSENIANNRALDVGCAVGRSTFELAREYSEVIGIDYSKTFISKCDELKRDGRAEYSMIIEGDLVEEKVAVVDPAIDRSRTRFLVGDACSLPTNLGGPFALVFGGNLICRLPEPMAFFKRLPDLVVSGGLLVLTSPYTWLDTYTPKNKWLGGFKDKEVAVRGFDTLKRVLGAHFVLVNDEELAFVIRETVRKHQWTVAHVTVWKRK